MKKNINLITNNEEFTSLSKNSINKQHYFYTELKKYIIKNNYKKIGILIPPGCISYMYYFYAIFIDFFNQGVRFYNFSFEYRSIPYWQEIISLDFDQYAWIKNKPKNLDLNHYLKDIELDCVLTCSWNKNNEYAYINSLFPKSICAMDNLLITCLTIPNNDFFKNWKTIKPKKLFV